MKLVTSTLILALTLVLTTADAQDGDLKPVPVKSGVAMLSQANSQINFVGIHEGAKPDPRKGGFGKFTGKATVSDDGKTIESVNIEIETAALWTEIDKLTNHLKSPDFFDVRRYPKASFASTKIAPTDKPGQVAVIGKLTLLGNTREISFPATVSVTDRGLTLESEFTIDRSKFGMDYGKGKVAYEVKMAVAIGRAAK